MASYPSRFRSEGTLIKQDDRTYWFAGNNFAGQEVPVLQAMSMVERLLGRKLNTFEFNLFLSRPLDGSQAITVVSMLVSNPSEANWIKSLYRTIVGYVVRSRDSAARHNYGDVIGSEGFYLTNGRLIGKLALTYKPEPGLEKPLFDPIDLVAGGLASLLTRGAAIAAETGVAKVVPEALAALEEAAPTRTGLRVLLVGPETESEFNYAASVMARGGKVTCVNPVRTAAADRFAASGGEFVQGEVAALPPHAVYDIIREDFPYPTGHYIDLAQSSARITRLRPGGSWVVVTEASDFADTLEAAAQLNRAKVLRRLFLAAHEASPVSAHPRALSRTALVITR